MVQEGLVCWEDSNSGCGGFSTVEEFEKSILVRKRSFGSGSGSGSVYGMEVNLKRVKLTGYDEPSLNLNQQGRELLNVHIGSSPLGLSLKKTPSFAEMIEAKLSQEKKTKDTQVNEESNESERARKKKEAEKWKASNWNAKLLRIGSWERHAVRDQDLVAKCYYQKRKLVWEMLDGGLKSKMEIQWSDITAIKAAFPENQNAVLEIEVKTVPLFFRETNPQPRKHTIWQPSPDFTGGQAPRYRRHYLQFEEGTLHPHFEKLLQCDRRLYMLALEPFPVNRSPYFHLDLSGNQDFSYESNTPTQMLQFSQYCGAQQQTHVPFPQVQMFQPTSGTDLASPMSVMEFAQAMHHRGNHNYIAKDTQFQYSEFPLVGQPISFQNPSSSGNGMHRSPSTNSLLKDMANQLLNAPVQSTCADEQKLMARINSMCNLLELSQGQVPNNCMDTSDTGYSCSTINSTSSRSTGESNENGRFVSSFKRHQRVSSFSNLFYEQTMEEFVAGVSVNRINN